MRGISQEQRHYRIERHSTLEQLCALEQEWAQLLDEVPGAPIFLTWDWVKTWWLFFGEGRELWLLTARDEQGRLLGIGPWMREEYRKAGLKLGMLAFIGTGPVCPVLLNIIARAADKEEVYRAFLSFLSDQPGQWDVLRISSVALGSPDHKLLKAAGARLRVGGEANCLYVPLPHSWEAFLKSASVDHRYNLRSSLRKLEAAYPGLVEFACVTDMQTLHAAMARLEGLIQERCHARKLPTAWDDPVFREFQRAIALVALQRGWLQLFTLTVKGQLVGVLCSFQFGQRVHGYSVGFDRAWRKYGPGHLMLGHGVRRAIESSALEMEMGRAGSAYKFDWTHHVRVEHELLFAHNWKGNLWITLGNFERSLRIRASTLLSRLASKRKRRSLSACNAKVAE